MKRDRNSFLPNNQNPNFFLNPQMQNPQMMNPQMMNPQMMQNPQMMNPQMMQNPQMMGPQMMPGMPNQMTPMQNNPNMVPEQMYQYGGYTNPEDYEMRITKIEKMLKKLDSRIAKIETKDGTIMDDDDITTSSNMYMI